MRKISIFGLIFLGVCSVALTCLAFVTNNVDRISGGKILLRPTAGSIQIAPNVTNTPAGTNSSTCTTNKPVKN